jgi:hypothetical protein
MHQRRLGEIAVDAQPIAAGVAEHACASRGRSRVEARLFRRVGEANGGEADG